MHSKITTIEFLTKSFRTWWNNPTVVHTNSIHTLCRNLIIRFLIYRRFYLSDFSIYRALQKWKLNSLRYERLFYLFVFLIYLTLFGRKSLNFSEIFFERLTMRFPILHSKCLFWNSSLCFVERLTNDSALHFIDRLRRLSSHFVCKGKQYILNHKIF